LAAVGYRPAKAAALTGGEAYFMAFRAVGQRPAPGAIKPCRAS